MIKLRYAAVALAAALMAVLCAVIPGQANALTLLGPAGGPQEAPGGTYFLQGQIVNLCVSRVNESRGYVEENSQALGNCAAGFVQLSVMADPFGLAPPASSPSPSPSASH